MWLDRLKDLKKQTGMSNEQIAEAAFMSEKTVSRVFSGENKNPLYDTLDRITKALGTSMEYIFSETKVVIGDENLATLQENVSIISAERDLLSAENAILKDKVTALTAELNLLKMELKHKEEIIALHNYYIKLKSTEVKE